MSSSVGPLGARARLRRSRGIRAGLLLVVVAALVVVPAASAAFGDSGFSLVDEFNRANEAPMANLWATSTTNSGWGGCEIVSQAVTDNTASGGGTPCMSHRTDTASWTDQEAKAELTVATGHVDDRFGVCVRITSVGSYCTRIGGTGTVHLTRRDGASFVTLATSTSGLTTGAIGISAIGTTIKGYRFTAGSWVEFGSVTDVNYGSGAVGVSASSTTGRLDSFGAGEVSAGDEPSSGGGFSFGIGGLLSSILCVLRNLALSILAVIIMAFNAVIAALAGVLATVVRLLPGFPSRPNLPAEYETASGWVTWFFPVGTVVSILAWFAVVWVVWQGVAIVLRWAKALS